MDKLNRRLFTIEQIDKMEKLAKIGRYQDIVSCIAAIDPEQEQEIQGVIDRNISKTNAFESKVMEKYRGVDINTPELEAEIQKELEVEWDTFIKGQVKVNTNANGDSNLGSNPIYASLKAAELKKIAKDRGIKLKFGSKNQDIIELLIASDNVAPVVPVVPVIPAVGDTDVDALKNLEPEI